MKSGARLAIGIPVFNGEKFLAETFDCFLAQTFQDFEILVGDNRSTDRTEEICRSYAARDSRIRYFQNARNLGAAPNFNKVFELSTAPLFKWAAHDDLYDHSYLETCVRALGEDDGVVLAHSGVAFIDETGAPFPFDAASGRFIDPKTGVPRRPDDPGVGESPIATTRFWQVLTRARWATHMFGVMRRAALARTGLLPNFASGDRAMLAELALLGRFRSTPERLFHKRFHEGVSWALNQRELKNFFNTDGAPYSRRARQIKAFFSTPLGKPIGAGGKALCMGMVAVHTFRTAAEALAQKDARTAAQGAAWRKQATSSGSGKGIDA